MTTPMSQCTCVGHAHVGNAVGEQCEFGAETRYVVDCPCTTLPTELTEARLKELEGLLKGVDEYVVAADAFPLLARSLRAAWRALDAAQAVINDWDRVHKDDLRHFDNAMNQLAAERAAHEKHSSALMQRIGLLVEEKERAEQERDEAAQSAAVAYEIRDQEWKTLEEERRTAIQALRYFMEAKVPPPMLVEAAARLVAREPK